MKAKKNNLPRPRLHYTALDRTPRRETAENAYATAFKTRVIGGIKDCGLDIPTGDSSVPFVQVKSSVRGLVAFLAESLRRKQFIPVCVGEPGARDEMLRHLKTYADMLDRLLRSIEKRDGRKPIAVADKYKSLTDEGMCREGTCQILADEKWSIRYSMLIRFPYLIFPYLFRVRKRPKKE